MINEREQTLSAIDDLDNHGFLKSNCTILFFFGINDDGERYVDAQMIEGHVDTYSCKELIETVMGPEDLHEAIIELAKKRNE